MSNQKKELKFSELVIYPCSRTYGSAPCAAAVGITGDFKCYNSPASCQDPQNYLAETEPTIVRLAIPTSDLPIDVNAIPCMTGISRRPQVVNPGEGLGVRESVTVSYHNFKHNDEGFDRYIGDRGFNTYNSGSFWGKFSARWGSIEGYEFRTVDGYLGQSIDEMTRRYYVVDSTNGPDAKGSFSITAKDAITLFNSDRAQYPEPSQGLLLLPITDVETAITLTPTGIGDLFYPASGLASIGDELVSYTRVGDAVTLTGRGLNYSDQEEHDEGETFQIAKEFTSQNPAQIFETLLEEATLIDQSYIDFDAWNDEVNEFLGRLYSAVIPKPTPVKTLLEDLVREAGLVVFTNLETKKIELQVLRKKISSTQINDDIILSSTIASKKMDTKRVSDIWVYYGRRNPLEKMDEKKNYAATYAKPTQNPVIALQNNPRAIREIVSRWITVFNSPAAVSVADRIIARYEIAPRQISLKVPNRYPLALGGQFSIQSRVFEGLQGGAADPIDCQITSIDDVNGCYSVVAEEMIFSQTTPADPNLRVISISVDTYNINLRELHDSIYSEVGESQTVRLVISGDAKIGSTSVDEYAFDVGSWPTGVTIEIGGTGRIQGAGGRGGGSGAGEDGFSGGGALILSRAVNIIGDVEIFGGGGGGGFGFNYSSGVGVGGGGAGFNPAGGATTELGQTATSTAGDGGGHGQPGKGGTVQTADQPEPEFYATFGGPAGIAVSGFSFLTITGTADIKGGTVG